MRAFYTEMLAMYRTSTVYPLAILLALSNLILRMGFIFLN